MGFRLRRVDTGRFLDRLRRRMENLAPLRPRVLDYMRRGAGGVEEQFESQQEFLLNGSRLKWQQSIRAQNHPFMGGTPLTLVDSGKLRNAWLGGISGFSEFRPSESSPRFTIGVSPVQLRYASTFQRKVPLRIRVNGRVVTITPRRVGVGRRMLRGVRDIVVAWIVRGARR